jgi:hypothetical protein
VPKSKMGIVAPRGESALADGTMGRADRFAREFAHAFQRHSAWPRRRNEQWIGASSGVLRHHVDLLAKALDAIVGRRTVRAGRTFEERFVDLVAQLGMVKVTSRSLHRKLERMLEQRVGVEGSAEAILRGVSSSMIGMGVAESGFLVDRKRRGK